MFMVFSVMESEILFDLSSWSGDRPSSPDWVKKRTFDWPLYIRIQGVEYAEELCTSCTISEKAAQNAEQGNKWILKERPPERIEHVSAFTRPSQHCEISQKSIRDWCSEIFWGTSLNLVTECPCHSI
jgi:hypothetical protein